MDRRPAGRPAGDRAARGSGQQPWPVVGTDGDGTGWLYRDGKLRFLSTPPGYDTVLVHAVNGRGDIVGTAQVRRLAPGCAVVDGPPPEVPAARPAGVVRDRDHRGRTIVGTVDDRPYRWTPQGVGTALAVPDGYTRASVDSAQGEWAIGMAPGGQRSGAVRMLPVRWNLATGAVSLLPFPGASGIAGNGDVLVVDGAPLVVAPDGTSRRLPGRPEVRATEAGTYTAEGISDDGLTVVGAVYENQAYRPLVWRCTR